MPRSDGQAAQPNRLKVVLFSGGRGSGRAHPSADRKPRSRPHARDQRLRRRRLDRGGAPVPGRQPGSVGLPEERVDASPARCTPARRRWSSCSICASRRAATTADALAAIAHRRRARRRRHRPDAFERSTGARSSMRSSSRAARPARRPPAALRRRVARVRPVLRLLRLQPRQPGVRRRLPARRIADFNRRGRRLLRARRAAARPHRERHRRHERLPRGARRRRPAARERGGDRRRRAAEPDPRDLPDRSPAHRAERGAGRHERRRRRRAAARARAAVLPINPRLAREDRRGRSDHLCAGHAALEPVPVLPDAAAWRR